MAADDTPGFAIHVRPDFIVEQSRLTELGYLGKAMETPRRYTLTIEKNGEEVLSFHGERMEVHAPGFEAVGEMVERANRPDRDDCTVDSCGEPAEYAGAYRLGDRKIILSFCGRHFDETHDEALDFDR